MRILVSAVMLPVPASRHIVNALKRLGHDVIVAGADCDGTKEWREHWRGYHWIPDIAVQAGPLPAVVNNRDVRAAVGSIDMVLQLDEHFVLSGSWDCPNVFWTVDDFDRPLPAIDFDMVFSAFESEHTRARNARFLPCAHDPLVHCDLSLERTIDIGLAGTIFPKRARLLADIVSQSGITPEVTNYLSTDAYNRFYNRVKVALAMSSRDTICQRVFENMAQGAIVLSEQIKDVERCGFIDGVHFMSFTNVKECIDKALWVLHNWDTGAVQNMRANAKTAVRPHTWEARAKVLCESC